MMIYPPRLTICVLLLCLLGSCASPDQPQKNNSLFSLMPENVTGVSFTNDVLDQKDFNIFSYRNFYNGGGVAIGDINNDSLPDIYFTANLAKNKLYVNRGNFRFEDITISAGVGGSKSWSTGVTMADVNGDGFLDIYVCNSGDMKGENKENELFINNGDLTFREAAKEFGLDNKGFSTHASFFDYDLDGDLDCYLLNNSFKSIDRIEQFLITRDVRDESGGDKLLRNDGNHFTDVSEAAGIYGGWIGFGLGVSVSDLNGDMLPDIYVSNDFWERDYLYINNGKGGFIEDIIARTSVISASSMGSDIADINNDGYADIFTTEMLPADNVRLKTMAKFEETNIKELKVRSSYHYQLMQNCLHYNDGSAYFQESANLAGVAATDWSWGSLMFDMDNDGWKDIFVSNGIYRDITSMDFSDFVADRENIKKIVLEKGKFDYQDLLALVPSTPLPNYGFLNNKGKTFTNATNSLGFETPSFSNGSAYADLDNDGDMDLVVNNINSTAFLYRNNTESMRKHNFIKVRFKGAEKNRFGIGAKVTLYTGGGIQVLQNYMTRGFQSSVEAGLIFGLGETKSIDSLTVVWPDMKVQTLKNVTVNNVVELAYTDAVSASYRGTTQNSPALLTDVSSRLKGSIRHRENRLNDFDHERLSPRSHSNESPRILTGDLDGDKRDDFIMLTASGSEDKIFFQNSAGAFIEDRSHSMAADSLYESTCGTLVDTDGDGDLDIVIGSGGNQKSREQTGLRLYENNGNRRFRRKDKFLPDVRGDFSCVLASDFDGDGHYDLFIGGRIVPGDYGQRPRSYLFKGDGTSFKDITPESLKNPGMVTCAVWTDADKDGKQDLVVTGEWMPVTIFKNTGNAIAEGKPLHNSNGWWNTIQKADLNNDGIEDLLIGNWGLNSKFQASAERPLKMFVSDFDQNGKTEPVILWYPPMESKPFPFASKTDLTAQIPMLKKRNLKYGDYAARQYEDIFDERQRSDAMEYSTYELRTCVFIATGDGSYSIQPMPIEAQVSPVFAITVADFDDDGNEDVFLAGNCYGLKPEVGRQDSNHGVVMLGNGKGGFTTVAPLSTGIRITGEVRDAQYIQAGDDNVILVGVNNSEMKMLKINSRKLNNAQ